jgi:hypothetical protein
LEASNERGFSWRLVELSTGKTLESGAGEASSRHKELLSWIFQTPSSSRTLVLAFTYARPAGEVRKAGKVELSDLMLYAISDKVMPVKASGSPRN